MLIESAKVSVAVAFICAGISMAFALLGGLTGGLPQAVHIAAIRGAVAGAMTLFAFSLLSGLLLIIFKSGQRGG